MRVLTLRGYEAYRANRHTRRLMHADHMCAMLILPALPHFSEATSDVSQPSEGAADAEAECRGNLLQGTRRAAEQQSSSERQGLAGACPGRSVWGLYWPGGFTAWLGVFSVSKLGWCESMTGVRNHRNEAEETKGFHHTPRCRVEIHAIKIITLSTKTSDSTTPSPIKSLLLYNLCCLDRNIEKQGLPLSIFQFSFCLKSSAWVKRWVKDSYTVRNMLQLLLWEVCITGVSV